MNKFSKFVGNKVLGWFLSNHTNLVNINELARELKISTGSVKKFVDLFHNEHTIDMKKIVTHIFTLTILSM